jgi:hypothetical protein
MKDFDIFCAGCGSLMSYQSAWRESLSGVRVCGEECHKKIQSAYCRSLLANGGIEIDINGEKHLLDKVSLSYEDVCMKVVGRVVDALTITYHKAAGDKQDGTLIKGQTVMVKPGTYISACFTGNA